MTDDQIIQRLDTIIAILQLAYRESIERSREQILADRVNAVILEMSVDWLPAGELTKAVSQKTGQSQRTVTRRLTGLVGMRALDRRGAGSSTAYKTTGLI
jgi:hypothetical protein